MYMHIVFSLKLQAGFAFVTLGAGFPCEVKTHQQFTAVVKRLTALAVSCAA